MRTLDTVAIILMIIGGLNWALVGLFRFDLVAALLGRGTLFSRVVYTVVGLCAAYRMAQWKAIQRRLAIEAITS